MLCDQKVTVEVTMLITRQETLYLNQSGGIFLLCHYMCLVLWETMEWFFLPLISRDVSFSFMSDELRKSHLLIIPFNSICLTF